MFEIFKTKKGKSHDEQKEKMQKEAYEKEQSRFNETTANLRKSNSDLNKWLDTMKHKNVSHHG